MKTKAINIFSFWDGNAGDGGFELIYATMGFSIIQDKRVSLDRTYKFTRLSAIIGNDAALSAALDRLTIINLRGLLIEEIRNKPIIFFGEQELELITHT